MHLVCVCVYVYNTSAGIKKRVYNHLRLAAGEKLTKGKALAIVKPFRGPSKLDEGKISSDLS